jgi:voltage-dependent potassium channel beta subunit
LLLSLAAVESHSEEVAMQYRYLGSSGLRVSALSFGTWVTFAQQIDEDLALECMSAAHELGVNFFDTAEVYAQGRAETMLGNIIRRAGWKRSDLVIATKVFWGGQGPNERGLSRKHLLEGTEASLERLGLGHVDLLFCHRPDPHTPIEETVRAMSHLVDRGKVHYWGTSEWSAAQIMEAWAVARREHLVPPTMEQPQYNMFVRERVEKEYLPLYERIGLGTTVWSPLASGLLTGKYIEGEPQDTRSSLPGYEWLRDRLTGSEAGERLPRVRALQPIAGELDCTLAQLALAWCLRNPHVSSVITGASRPEQVVENMRALEVVPRLTDEVRDRIEKVLGNRPEPAQDFRE